MEELKKKHRGDYNNLLKKINQVVNSTPETIEHYKHLHPPFKEFQRVHVNTNFVLTFKYDKQNNFILFQRYKHHDEIYEQE